VSALRFLAPRAEGVALVAILLTVATFAGAASFTHVHDWTMRNSPAGTPDWFGWANATISELVPTACALVIRRRRRSGAPVGYPLGLLAAAVSLSLAAQLAVAKPGPSGWLLSAVPALAFLALTKLVLSTKPATTPAANSAAAAAAASSSNDSAEAAAASVLVPAVSVLVPTATAPVTRPHGAIPSGVIR
jgi:hypothetical protein